MLGLRKSGARRAEIRKNRPDAGLTLAARLRAEGGLIALGIVAAFCIGAIAILLLRENVVQYRVGQFVHHDIVSRVEFKSRDDKRLAAVRERRREAVPRYYKPADPDPWKVIEDRLLSLPDLVKGANSVNELPADLQ